MHTQRDFRKPGQIHEDALVPGPDYVKMLHCPALDETGTVHYYNYIILNNFAYYGLSVNFRRSLKG